MRQKIVAGNWKMNTTPDEGMILLSAILKNSSSLQTQNKQVIIIPPFTHLALFSEILTHSSVKLGAQNIFHETSGAYTGEVSANMIKNAGAKYVLIGHSERRQYFNEGNTLLSKKILLALSTDLLPIYCCGEIEKEREAGLHFEVIQKQIEEGLFHLQTADIQKIIIAYEPVWAIGTGKNASPEQANEIHRFIRNLLSKKYSDNIADNISILYGGSIKSSNAKDLFSMDDIDGGLVGGASLHTNEFIEIFKSL